MLWSDERQAFSVQISRHTFFSKAHGFIFSSDAMQLRDAEAMGFEGVYVYALSYSFVSDHCFVQIAPMAQPVAPESFLRMAWTKSACFSEKPDVMMLHKAVPTAFPELEANLRKIGIPSRIETRPRARFTGVYRSLGHYGYQEFFWVGDRRNDNFMDFAPANEFLVEIQEAYRRDVEAIHGRKQPRRSFEPKGWRDGKMPDAGRVRAALEPGRTSIAPVRSMVLALGDDRDDRRDVYFVAGRGEVSRAEFDAFRARERAEMEEAAKAAMAHKVRDKVESLGDKRWDLESGVAFKNWLLSDPEAARYGLREHVRKIASLWPTGAAGLGAAAGVTKREMTWFLSGRQYLAAPHLERLARAVRFTPERVKEGWLHEPVVLRPKGTDIVLSFIEDMHRSWICPLILCELTSQDEARDPDWRLMLFWEKRYLHGDKILPHAILFEVIDPRRAKHKRECHRILDMTPEGPRKEEMRRLFRMDEEEEEFALPDWMWRLREDYFRCAISPNDYRDVLKESIDFCADPSGSLDRMKKFWLGRQPMLRRLEKSYMAGARKMRA